MGAFTFIKQHRKSAGNLCLNIQKSETLKQYRLKSTDAFYHPDSFNFFAPIATLPVGI
jgi:hypothetical protein